MSWHGCTGTWTRRSTCSSFLRIAGIVPGALAVQTVPAPRLEVLVGGTVLVALATAQMSRSSPWRPGAKPLAAAGSVSAFMNATAGVGGLALSVYALRTRREQTEFSATMQPHLLTIGLASVAAKLVARPSSHPGLSPWVWVAIVASICAGLVAGEVLSHRTGLQTARRLMLTLAYVGSIATVAWGVLELLP
ncbi:TSUP family transporter [Sinomonas sp. JGH33]|uniref:Probable membrane transporter protein n=1 Tax=Sinomonas terricola TaxID=3110330 RepID=A0ABU5T246_9MICC|nr:TSUP family transporter [Sinomonas sp. JGH33]MEA5453724.1 TSUP family transporter [Sinomonas sp. JGH33]